MNRIGMVYGQGLYMLAKEEGLEESVLQQLQVLQMCFAEQPAYLKLLASHSIPKQERVEILDKDFREKLHSYVLNFLKLLTEKGYIRHFSDCCKAYTEQYDADAGILRVQAVSAIELSEAQKRKLTEKLMAATGKKIALACKVDPSVLGGVRLNYDGKQIDGTLQGRFEQMAKNLKNTVI